MKKRLDQILVERKLYPSQSKAQAAIMAGVVFVAGQKVDKAGTLFPETVEIKIKSAPHPYVGRGGLKLEKALKEFAVKVKNKVCLDVGASTGGFTDCLLQKGAKQVFAVDVGYGQLDWKLRNDPKVKVFERVNARNLTLADLGLETLNIELVVIDVSFISLTKILPVVYALLTDKAEVVALIKPQFEAKREQVEKGGIVRDPKVHEEVIERVKKSAQEIGFVEKGIIDSPITGADGNREFLVYLIKNPHPEL